MPLSAEERGKAASAFAAKVPALRRRPVLAWPGLVRHLASTDYSQARAGCSGAEAAASFVVQGFEARGGARQEDAWELWAKAELGDGFQAAWRLADVNQDGFLADQVRCSGVGAPCERAGPSGGPPRRKLRTGGRLEQAHGSKSE